MPVPGSHYELLPPQGPRDPEQVSRVVNDIRDGRMNVASSVTFEVGATETQIANALIGATTEPLLVPRSADAADIKWWVKERGRRSIMIGHEMPGVAVEYGLILIG